MDEQKNEFTKLELKLLIIVFLLLVIVNLMLFGNGFIGNYAQALAGNYFKSAGAELSTGDWNNILVDFLAKDGGSTVNGINNAMQGNLNMGGNQINGLGAPTQPDHAATVAYANSMAGAGAKDPNGSPLKIVCGSTQPGATNWQSYSGVGLQLEVYTTQDGTNGGTPNFTSWPLYFTSIEGTGAHEEVDGVVAIYNPIALPDDKVFKVYIFTDKDPATANALQWHINWCGVGN